MNNFRNLNDRQLDVFQRIATNDDMGHDLRSINALIKRGLIEEYYQAHYRVPLIIHAEWCAWCAEHEEGEEV